MMKKIVDNIIRLKKYFELSCLWKEFPRAALLSSNEALKAFGKVGGEYRPDLMTMLAVIEYEYGRGKNYSEVEMVAVKKTLAEVSKFFTGCTKEWQDFEATQSKK